MKRYNLIAAVVLTLVLVCASASFAVFPKPDGYVEVPMQQGWYGSQPAWFICTTTNSIRLSFDGIRLLTPKLTSALVGAEPAARPYYVVTNFNNFPVFSTRPGNADYSSIWQLFTVTWKPGFAHPITNTEPASPTNPNGLPPAGEADIAATGIVDRCPILAIGPLGRPWNCIPHNGYRIPQGSLTLPGRMAVPLRHVILPFWYVNCQAPCTNWPMAGIVIITDTSSSHLAGLLGANLAPGLLNVPMEDTTDFWDFAPTTAPAQLPVIRDCPAVNPRMICVTNTNFNYSSVMRYVVLFRFVQPWVNITTVQQVLFYLDNGKLQIVGSPEMRLGADVLIAGG